MAKLIRILYLLPFAILLISPHIMPEHIFSLPRAYAESLATILVFGATFLIYYLHHLALRQKDVELKSASQRLLAAFKYIGTANRRLPLLKNLTSDLLANPKVNKKEKNQIFQSLLATVAMSIANVDWCILRFLDVETNRTVKEHIYTKDELVVIKNGVGNNTLLRSRGQKHMHDPLEGLVIIPTTEEEAIIQGFLILPASHKSVFQERWTLQAITDQAQLFYKYLY